MTDSGTVEARAHFPVIASLSSLSLRACRACHCEPVEPVIASLSSNPSCRPDRSGGTIPHLDRRDLDSRFDYAQRDTGLLDKLAMTGKCARALTGKCARASTGVEPAPFLESFRAIEPQYAARIAAAG